MFLWGYAQQDIPSSDNESDVSFDLYGHCHALCMVEGESIVLESVISAFKGRTTRGMWVGMKEYENSEEDDNMNVSVGNNNDDDDDVM